MNNEEIKTKPEKKKKHFPFWIILVLLVVVYALGILTGLKLSTMNAPFNVVEKIFPTEQSVPADISDAELPADSAAPAAVNTSAPTASPRPTASPKPTATPAPSAAPALTPAPAEEASMEEAEAADEILPVIVEAAAPAKVIGIDSAVDAAMAFKGLNAAETEVTGVYRDESAGIAVYAVELAVNGKEYRFDVNAYTGEVEGWRQLRSTQSDTVQIIIPETQPDKTSSSASGSSEVIQVELAEEFALMHAGIKRDLAKDISTKLINDGKTQVYEVIFDNDGYHYIYRVDADNGDILGFSKAVG